MGLILGLLLIVLGLVAARDFLVEKVPAMRRFIDALQPFAQYAGLAALLFGFVGLIQAVGMLRYFGYGPVYMLMWWITIALLFALGLIFSIDFFNRVVVQPSPAFLVKVNRFTARLLPHKRNLGLAGIVFGILILF